MKTNRLDWNAIEGGLKTQLADAKLGGARFTVEMTTGGKGVVIDIVTPEGVDVPISAALRQKLYIATDGEVGQWIVPEFDPGEFPMYRGLSPSKSRPQRADFASEPAFYAALVGWEKRLGLAPGQKPTGT